MINRTMRHARSPLPRASRPGGFTLVELLVVVGIIAILAAVTLSAAIATLRSARVAKCTSNLSQISAAFQSYLSDNNSVMPQRFYNDGTHYFVLLEPYAGGNSTDKAHSIFVCPSHAANNFPAQPSYGMNWYYDNTSVTQVPGFSTTIMVAETYGEAGSGSSRADQFCGEPGVIDKARHGSTSNYLFFDGHVERLTYQATLNGMWGDDHGNHDQPDPVGP